MEKALKAKGWDSMKVLILGSTGMAGHMISLYLREAGYEVVGFSRHDNSLCPGIVGDALDTALISQTISQGHFDYVINCIGVLNQFAEQDHANAVYMNAYLPHFLAKVTLSTETRVLHMSTDCVFSGEQGHYERDSLRDGRSFYDRSKALGELEDDRNITLRNSIVGPDTRAQGIGLLNWFMQQDGPINGYTGAVWTGQTTLQLAKTMDAVMRHGASGLYNAVPEVSINKYELLCLFNHYLRGDALKIRPVEGVKLNKSLVSTPFPFDYHIPDYETMVKDMADWIFSHKELYRHYKL
jgi:dTDP-4-dehydrorhamnose reductase